VPSFKYQGHRIDEKSQTILRILRARGTDVETAYLRKHIGADDNKIVLYRMNEHLVPAGLVEKSGEENWYPGLPPGSLWSITDEGREWLTEHDDEIVDAADINDALDEIQHVRKGLDEFWSRLNHVAEKYDNRTETLEDHVDRIRRLEEARSNLSDAVGYVHAFRYGQNLNESNIVDELQHINRELSKIDRRLNSLESLESKVSDLETKIERIENSDKRRNDRLDDLEDQVGDYPVDERGTDAIGDRLAAVDDRTADVDALTGDVRELEERIDSQAAEIAELRDAAERSAWDDLLPWR
jgi:ubiquinone biosynthesis protein UbiJ